MLFHPRVPTRPAFWAGVLTGLALGLALFVTPVRGQSLEPQAFGHSITSVQCLEFTALGYRDHHGDLQNYDWITLQLQNNCGFAITHVHVEFFLVDQQGYAYGRRLWVLARGEALRPTGVRKDRWPIPDNGDRTAQGWALRVIGADRLRARSG